ncbi:hypothetical protein NBRC3279_1766 [Acetobacter pasteurianus NBRC 3279]|nr:hypothetical protein NBRC3279_1766 [Acetobacter pasteurianus NBRC 3279]GCD72584.1 hypothetical protein NBRC3284_1740 [Acetobacter pasteurianus NBRC 3284]
MGFLVAETRIGLPAEVTFHSFRHISPVAPLKDSLLSFVFAHAKAGREDESPNFTLPYYRAIKDTTLLPNIQR